ncbi:MAG: hypothetical protein U0793_33710 [Gemmataceae bacterium]
MKRFLGCLALLLGLVGLIACVGGIVVVWVYQSKVVDGADHLLDVAEQKLKEASGGLERIEGMVDAVKGYVDPATKTLASLGDRLRDLTPEEERILAAFEKNALARLQKIQGMVEAAQAAVTLFGAVGDNAGKLPGLGKAPSVIRDAGINVKEAAAALSDVADFLETVQATLREYRADKRLLPATAAKVAALAAEIDARLTRLRERLGALRTGVGELAIEAAAWRAEAPR